MYGMVIVEPAEGLLPSTTSSRSSNPRWYLGEQGQPADLTKAMAAAPAPDFVLFNGEMPTSTSTQSRSEPVVGRVVLNAGPSIDSSYVVGTIFDTVIKEGVWLKKGNEGNWGSQAVDLAPAQGRNGRVHDRRGRPVSDGYSRVQLRWAAALGLFQAGDGDPLN